MTTKEEVSSASVPFSLGEKVLCFHYGQLYEAKIMKVERDKTQQMENAKFHVHYNGWKKTWDEWVPESKLLKLTDVNLAKQSALRAAAGSPTPVSNSRRSKGSVENEEAAPASLEAALARLKASNNAQKENHFGVTPDRRSVSSTTSSSSRKGAGSSASQKSRDFDGTMPAPPAKAPVSPVIVGGTSTRPIISGAGGTTRGRSAKLSQADSHDAASKRRRTELPIQIPESLKRRLVEDWDLVSREANHLVVVPAEIVVETILSDYLKDRAGRPDPCVRSEFVASLKEYFNIMLGPQLLYRFERRQFDEQQGGSGDAFLPSRVYGAVHLLRMFVKLGSVLSYTPLNQEESRMLLDVSHDFLDFLVQRQNQYFDVDRVFKPTPSGYAKLIPISD